MAKHRRKKGLKAKDVIVPTVFVILAAFVFLAGLNIAAQNGFTLPGIGIAGIVGNNGASGGTSSSGGKSSSGYTLLPPNKIGFSTILVAAYTDGSTETIATQNSGNLPTLDLTPASGSQSSGPFVVRVHGKPIKQVEARAIAAVSSPTDHIMPAGSSATFKLNFTAVNLQTGYTKWNYEEITTNFINNSIAMVYLPLLAVLPTEAFSNYCANAANGTAICSPPSAPATHTVNWVILATVVVSTPTYPQFALISGSTVSTAQFNADGSIISCTNCSPTPTPTSVSLPNTGGDKPIPEPLPKGCTGTSCGSGPIPPAVNGNYVAPVHFVGGGDIVSGHGGCVGLSLFPLFCTVGNTVKGVSLDKSVKQIIAGSKLSKPNSLLPENYIPFTLGGSVTLLNKEFFVALIAFYSLVVVVGVLVIRKIMKH